MGGRFLLAQISDTHIRADDNGAATAKLKKAMAQAAEYRVDAILLTGDLANDERTEEYEALARALLDPPAPVYLMPGNHDERTRLRYFFPSHAYLPHNGNLSYAIEDFPVRIVVVDQIVPGETHGLLTQAGAEWLDRALSAAPDKPTIVALHHPPFLTHDLLFDNIGLHDSDLLAGVIAKHRQVMRVICGHHHRVAFGQIAHAPVIVAPSTSWVYGIAMYPGQPIAPRTDEQTGWMLHAWTQAGGCASHFIGI